jgi:hypothetical protein
MVGGEIKGTGWGRSKKQAEQEAARNALWKLEIQSVGEASPGDQSETNPNIEHPNDPNE